MHNSDEMPEKHQNYQTSSHNKQVITQIDKKMNILVTGATGSVGYDLVNYLSKNHKIYALYRKTQKTKIKKNVIWIKLNLYLI